MGEREPGNKMDKREIALGILAIPLILASIIIFDAIVYDFLNNQTLTETGALVS